MNIKKPAKLAGLKFTYRGSERLCFLTCSSWPHLRRVYLRTGTTFGRLLRMVQYPYIQEAIDKLSSFLYNPDSTLVL